MNDNLDKSFDTGRLWLNSLGWPSALLLGDIFLGLCWLAAHAVVVAADHLVISATVARWLIVGTLAPGLVWGLWYEVLSEVKGDEW